jgi:hypothetical protein
MTIAPARSSEHADQSEAVEALFREARRRRRRRWTTALLGAALVIGGLAVAVGGSGSGGRSDAGHSRAPAGGQHPGGALTSAAKAAETPVNASRGTSVTVWMEPIASRHQISAVGRRLHRLHFLHDCVYKDKRRVYAQARRLLAPDELEVLTIATMPTFYSCVALNPADASQVLMHVGGRTGVRDVLWASAHPDRNHP